MPSLIIFKSLYALLILLDSKASSNEATWLGFTLGQWDPQEYFTLFTLSPITPCP